jgi:hypothetical protein
MHVVNGVTGEDAQRPLGRLVVLDAHPQEDAAGVELLLQPVGVTLVDDVAEHVGGEPARDRGADD